MVDIFGWIMTKDQFIMITLAVFWFNWTIDGFRRSAVKSQLKHLEARIDSLNLYVNSKR